MGLQSRDMRAQALRSLAFGGISGTYATIGTPLINQIRIIHLSNLTDKTIIFSFTGNTDHIILPSGGFILLDLCSNKINDGGLFVSNHTQMYAKDNGSAATSGAVYVSAFYAREISG